MIFWTLTKHMSFLRRLSLATSGNINEVGASHFQKQKVRELKKKKRTKG